MNSKNEKKLKALSVMMAMALFGGGAEAASYIPPSAGLPGKISLSDVTIHNGNGQAANSASAILKSLDNSPLYSGQIYQVLNGNAPTGTNEDAIFTQSNQFVNIPNLIQNSLISACPITIKIYQEQ